MFNILNKMKSLLGPSTNSATANTHRTSNDSIKVFDCKGLQQNLAPLLARGGEGEIYPLQDRPDVLVKYYIPTVRSSTERWKQTCQKITKMIQMDTFVTDTTFAWPRLAVFDQQSHQIGYAMKLLKGVPIQTLCNQMLFKERFPNWTRSDLVQIALNLLKGIDKVHRHSCLLGDINPANFLINEHQQVFFIDCDSFQVAQGTHIYPCPVGIPMYTAPELLDKRFSQVTRTIESEYYSIAIMLFKILMLGRHPYDRVGGSDPVENMKSGKCPLGTGSGCTMPKGPWYNIWSHLPRHIKSLFISTFREGHHAPQHRPTVREWIDALSRYKRDISKEFCSNAIVPSTPKSSKYHGKKEINHEPLGKQSLLSFN